MAGISKPDEARRRLNKGPVQGGDTPYLQQQNFGLAALAKRDASPDPFRTAAPAAAAPAPDQEPADDLNDEDAAAEARAFLDHIRKGLIECGQN